MAKSERQKLKLLCLAQIFWQKTDKDTAFSIKELIDRLAGMGITAGRKSLYDDIRLLREYGMDIRINENYGYYLASRFLEKDDLKILMDALYSARFLSQRKSRDLIRRLGLLVSNSQRKQMIRQLVEKKRSRCEGVDCYRSIHLIYEAILKNRQLSFLCFRLTPERKLYVYNKRKPFVVSPWELYWHNNHYYLICYRTETERMEYFRIDRLMEIRSLKIAREGMELFEKLDFSHLNPEEVAGSVPTHLTGVTLRCTNNLASAVLERFGRDVILVPEDDTSFTAAVNIALGPRFYAWVFSYGGEMKIISPKNIVDEMRQMICRAGEDYGVVMTAPEIKTGEENGTLGTDSEN